MRKALAQVQSLLKPGSVIEASLDFDALHVLIVMVSASRTIIPMDCNQVSLTQTYFKPVFY